MHLKNTIFEKMNSMSDGSWKLTFVTRELSPDEITELAKDLRHEVEAVEIETVTPEEGKTHSGRMRGVIFRIWEQKHKDNLLSAYREKFNLYYNDRMEKLINKLKEELN